MSTDHDAVLATLQAINHAWTTGDFTGFDELFREDVAMAMPGFGDRVAGRAALTDSYRQFAAACTLLAYSEGEPMVELFDDAAIATYPFTISYEMEGNRYDESGRDLFLLLKQEGRWQAAWRAMLDVSSAI